MHFKSISHLVPRQHLSTLVAVPCRSRRNTLHPPSIFLPAISWLALVSGLLLAMRSLLRALRRCWIKLTELPFHLPDRATWYVPIKRSTLEDFFGEIVTRCWDFRKKAVLARQKNQELNESCTTNALLLPLHSNTGTSTAIANDNSTKQSQIQHPASASSSSASLAAFFLDAFAARACSRAAALTASSSFIWRWKGYVQVGDCNGNRHTCIEKERERKCKYLQVYIKGFRSNCLLTVRKVNT